MARVWASVALGLAVSLVGCQATDLHALDGTQWRAVRVDDIVAVPAPPPMLTFRGRDASGSGLCSTFTITTITIDAAAAPPRFGFGSLSTTTSGCFNEELQRVDRAFLDALSRAQTIELVGGRLVIDGPGGTIVFDRVQGAS